MTFNKENLYTYLNKENAPIGSLGFFDNSLKGIMDSLEHFNKHKCSTLLRVNDDAKAFVESGSDKCKIDPYEFFYMVELPKESMRPFKTCQEVSEHLHFGDRIIRERQEDVEYAYYMGCAFRTTDSWECAEDHVEVFLSNGEYVSAECLLKYYTGENGKRLGVNKRGNE